jgi:hypothetical protein
MTNFLLLKPYSYVLAGHGKYSKIQDLKAGSFGFVVLARDKDSGEQVTLSLWGFHVFNTWAVGFADQHFFDIDTTVVCV